jgi:hypothetical protein
VIFSGRSVPCPDPADYNFVVETLDWYFAEEKTKDIPSPDQWGCLRDIRIECLSISNNVEKDDGKIALKALMLHTND